LAGLDADRKEDNTVVAEAETVGAGRGILNEEKMGVD
jgi:hypothetical protein